MENKLSTVLTRIDLKELLEHYTDKALWGKKWTIYDYGGINVRVELFSIEVAQNMISLCVTVTLAKSGEKAYGFIYVPINHCEYRQETFERRLYGEAKDSLSELEKVRTKRLPDYEAADNYRDEKKEKLEEEAKAWLDDKGVTNESIRDAYIEAFIEANTEDVDEMVNAIIERHKDKLFAKEQMLLADFFKREKEFKYFYDLVAKKGGSKSRITVWLQKQKDQEIDWKSVCDDFMKTEGQR